MFTFFEAVLRLLGFILNAVLNVIIFLSNAFITFVKNHKEFSFGFATCMAITLVVFWIFYGDYDNEPKIVRTYEVYGIEALDGNTILVKYGIFGLKRRQIVLSKMKAPELNMPYGIEAKNFLNDLIEKQRLRIEQYADDISSGGIVYNSHGQCIQREMIINGYAWRTGTLWLKEENEAKRKKLGIWSIYRSEIIMLEDRGELVDQKLILREEH